MDSWRQDALQKKLTKIAPIKKSALDYDLIIIGTPIWARAPTPAVRTYVSQNSLSGKRVALFYTFDSDMKKGAERTKAMLTNAIIVSDYCE
jgi:flavodoxin